MRSAGARAALAVAGLCCLALITAPLSAQSLHGTNTAVANSQDTAQAPRPESAPTFRLRTALKTTGLLSRAPDDPILFPVRDTATSFWRIRLEPEVRLGPRLTATMAYEQRLRVFSQPSGLAAGAILPAETPGPFRMRQLDWSLVATSGTSWRHEVDRASVGVHLDRTELTIGRQAIGWGRGWLFSAVDIFSPFSPVEVDREWRRGVDAIRADVQLADRVSLDFVSAVGPTVDESVFATRFRGYTGQIDLEVMGGRRARDLFVGATTSAAVADGELHGEFALYRLPEGSLPTSGTSDQSERLVVKAVAGGSYQLPIGHGVLISAEYHYSGFGATRPGDILGFLQDARFRQRYQRGDTQILQRHAMAVTGSYEFSPEWRIVSLWLHSPVDGSGLWSPSATLTLGDRLSVLGGVYLPYGRTPVGASLRSEYGTMPRSLLVQLRVYGS